jgi:hypothetical protein
MKIKEEGWNIVLVGKWNKYILSPEWSAQNIFGVDRVNVEFGINVDVPPRYTANNVNLVASEDIVIFSYKKYDDETLDNAVNACTSLLNKLPFTPVAACGINFGFSEGIQDSNIGNLFSFDDDDRLISFGSVITSKSVSRKLTIRDRILNFNVSKDNEQIDFSFNFHYDVKSCEGVETAIGSLKDNLEIARGILQDIYGLVIDAEE